MKVVRTYAKKAEDVGYESSGSEYVDENSSDNEISANSGKRKGQEDVEGPKSKKMRTASVQPCLGQMNKACMLSMLTYLRECMSQVHGIMQGDPEHFIKENAKLKADVARLNSEKRELIVRLAAAEQSGGDFATYTPDTSMSSAGIPEFVEGSSKTM